MQEQNFFNTFYSQIVISNFLGIKITLSDWEFKLQGKKDIFREKLKFLFNQHKGWWMTEYQNDWFQMSTSN